MLFNLTTNHSSVLILLQRFVLDFNGYRVLPAQLAGCRSLSAADVPVTSPVKESLATAKALQAYHYILPGWHGSAILHFSAPYFISAIKTPLGRQFTTPRNQTLLSPDLSEFLTQTMRHLSIHSATL